MITLENGEFSHPELHHKGWFRVFKFRGIIEIWFGKRWIEIEWRY